MNPSCWRLVRALTMLKSFYSCSVSQPANKLHCLALLFAVLSEPSLVNVFVVFHCIHFLIDSSNAKNCRTTNLSF